METVPSWQTDVPAKAQAAKLDALNFKMPEPQIPAATSQHEPMPDATAAQMLPAAPQEQPAQMKPTSPTEEAPPKFEDTEEAPPKFEDTEEAPPKFEDTSPTPEQTAMDNYQEARGPNMGALRKYIDSNLQVYNAANSGKPKTQEQKEVSSFLESIEAGLQMSTAGLAVRGQMPSVVMPEHAPRAYRIANQISMLAGDMPAMAAGGFFGALGGGAAGTAALPVVGTVSGAAVGGMAGTFAMPAALRKIMMDHYEKGDIKDAGDFADRLMSTSWEATKGAVTGAATALTGGAFKVLGPMATMGAELGAMTTVGAAMEGHLPSQQDFEDGALVIGGLHGVSHVSAKLRNIYATTGARPEQVLAAANVNPQLKSDILSLDKQSPPEAAPHDLVSEHVKNEDGTTAGIDHKLVPQDLSIKGPEEIPAPEGRAPEAQEILDHIKPKIKETTTLKEKADAWYANSVDYLDPLKVDYEAWKAKTGKELTAEDNPYIKGRLLAGHKDLVRRVLEEGVPDMNGEFPGRGINQVYREVPEGKQADFDAYSLAKAGIEVDDQGKVPWKNFNREGAEKVVADGAATFEKLHRERVKLQNDMLDYGVRKGVIDAKQSELTKEARKEYIPLEKIVEPDEMTQETGKNGKIIKKLKGAELELQNPREIIYKNMERILKRVAVNDIRLQTLENFSYENEAGQKVNDFVREVEPANMPVRISAQELASNDYAAYKKQMKDAKPNATNEQIKRWYEGEDIPEFRGVTVWRPQRVAIGENQIPVYRAGKMMVLEGSPLTIDTLKRLEGDPAVSGMVTKVASKFSQSVRAGQLIDPGFAVRHFIRAGTTAGFYSQTGQIPFWHQFSVLPEFLKKEKSPMFKDWASNGGATAAMDKLSEDYISNDLQAADSKYPMVNNMWNLIKEAKDSPESFIKLTDNLSRFAEYKRAIELKGKSPTEAAFMAREVTPDFAKMGLQRGMFRTSVAFIGAHINSMDRMAQSFKEDTQGTILRMSALSVVSAGMWYVNKDDDLIENLPEWRKDLAWNFNISRFSSDYEKNAKMVNGKLEHEGTVISIPKPWGPGILFGTGMEKVLDGFFKDHPEALDGFVKALKDSVVPNLMPSMLAPIADQFANKNSFSGRQLVNSQQVRIFPFIGN